MLKSVAERKNSRVYSFSCPPELYQRAVSVCNLRGCSKSWLISNLLERYLNEIEEDMEDYEIAVAAWEDFEKNGGKTYSAEEVFAEAGL